MCPLLQRLQLSLCHSVQASAQALRLLAYSSHLSPKPLERRPPSTLLTDLMLSRDLGTAMREVSPVTPFCLSLRLLSHPSSVLSVWALSTFRETPGVCLSVLLSSICHPGL